MRAKSTRALEKFVASIKWAPSNAQTPPGEPMNNQWRKHAEAKAEDLRQLLIELDFRIQDQSGTACRETIAKIEAKTHELRVMIAQID